MFGLRDRQETLRERYAGALVEGSMSGCGSTDP